MYHEKLVAAFSTYIAESAKFEEKGVKASASRARKALVDVSKLCKERRKEIIDSVNAEKEAPQS